MANKTAKTRMRCVCGCATAAQVNSGLVILPPSQTSGRTVSVQDGWLRALGGNAGGATSVDITDTAASPVTAFSMAVGGLTQDAVARVGLATHSTNTNVGEWLTPGQGLRIGKTGGSLTTASHVDYCIFYTVR